MNLAENPSLGQIEEVHLPYDSLKKTHIPYTFIHRWLPWQPEQVTGCRPFTQPRSPLTQPQV